MLPPRQRACPQSQGTSAQGTASSMSTVKQRHLLFNSVLIWTTLKPASGPDETTLSAPKKDSLGPFALLMHNQIWNGFLTE
mmetsp:Transcript_42842/g.167422  ORF Transcript_42842/g.167422 Transcript_42842/m.167422 type:complete len:81 (-) Transcript_42842:1162-1404(-)